MRVFLLRQDRGFRYRVLVQCTIRGDKSHAPTLDQLARKGAPFTLPIASIHKTLNPLAIMKISLIIVGRSLQTV